MSAPLPRRRERPRADSVPNVVFLAAELTAADVSPARAAILACELVELGRRYKRLKEKLCGGEEEWGAWSDDVAKLQERAMRRCEEIRAKVIELLKDETRFRCVVEGDSLVLRVHSRPSRRKWPDAVTALM